MQRRATQIVYDFWNLKYEERLERLNMFSLQYMRMRGDMIETYKIISGLEDVSSSQFFARSSMDNLHGNSLKQYQEHFHQVIHKEFFSQRVIDQWNGLPEEVVKSENVEQFQEFIR